MNQITSQKYVDAFISSIILYDQDDRGLKHPSETLVRLFKGDYIPNLQKDKSGLKILDVGCGNGNNTVFFKSIGFDAYGVEIDQKIVDYLNKKFNTAGVTFRQGLNSKLPFEDNTFDFLVSWNVIHYEGNHENILRALEEYKRVLKPSGRVLISTTGLDHKILENVEKVRPHEYKIGKKADPRCGQTHYFFETKEHLKEMTARCFHEIHIGEIYNDLFSSKLHSLLVTGQK